MPGLIIDREILIEAPVDPREESAAEEFSSTPSGVADDFVGDESAHLGSRRGKNAASAKSGFLDRRHLAGGTCADEVRSRPDQPPDELAHSGTI